MIIIFMFHLSDDHVPYVSYVPFVQLLVMIISDVSSKDLKLARRLNASHGLLYLGSDSILPVTEGFLSRPKCFFPPGGEKTSRFFTDSLNNCLKIWGGW